VFGKPDISYVKKVILVEFWLEIGLFCLCFGFYIALWRQFQLFSSPFAASLSSLNSRAAALESWRSELDGLLEAQAKAETVRLSEQGKKGVQVREENKEMRAAATNEGRVLLSSLTPDILTNPQKQNEAKGKLAALAMKYPRVAEEVSESLFREFRVEEPIKGMIKSVIANALLAQKDGAYSTAPKENWYGLEV